MYGMICETLCGSDAHLEREDGAEIIGQHEGAVAVGAEVVAGVVASDPDARVDGGWFPRAVVARAVGPHACGTMPRERENLNIAAEAF